MRKGQKRDFARALRRNMTDAETALWQRLRRRQLQGHRFRRQCPIGPWIADFACLERRLVVEVDGGQHAGSQRDADREAWLHRQGFVVLRFWNNEVLEHIEGVCDMILDSLSKHPCPDAASHAGEGQGRMPRVVAGSAR
jgi:very-short-patch-repair endonuclease